MKPFRIVKMLGRVQRGFTLVEILVVIGILMLLGALLFPVFSRARENGKRTVCLSNLKQVALSLEMYTQDNNRRYPPAPPTPPTGLLGWSWAVKDIAKSDEIFQCPSEGKKPDEGFSDYWMNANLLGKSDVRIRQPASVILNGDGEANSVEYALAEIASSPDWEQWDKEDPYATRHLGGANYSFADGHVKFLKPDQVTTSAPDGTNFSLLIQ